MNRRVASSPQIAYYAIFGKTGSGHDLIETDLPSQDLALHYLLWTDGLSSRNDEEHGYWRRVPADVETSDHMALLRTYPDRKADRNGYVITDLLLVPWANAVDTDDMDGFITKFKWPDAIHARYPLARKTTFQGLITDQLKLFLASLVDGNLPIVVSELTTYQTLVHETWHRLPPELRRNFRFTVSRDLPKHMLAKFDLICALDGLTRPMPAVQSTLSPAAQYLLTPNDERATPYRRIAHAMHPQTPTSFRELSVWNQVAELHAKLATENLDYESLLSLMHLWQHISPHHVQARKEKLEVLTALKSQLPLLDIDRLLYLRNVEPQSFFGWETHIVPALRDELPNKILTLNASSQNHLLLAENDPQHWWNQLIQNIVIEALADAKVNAARVFWEVVSGANGDAIASLKLALPVASEILLANEVPTDLKTGEEWCNYALQRGWTLLHAAILARHCADGESDDLASAEARNLCILEAIDLQLASAPDSDNNEGLLWLLNKLERGHKLVITYLNSMETQPKRTIALACEICSKNRNCLMAIDLRKNWGQAVWTQYLANNPSPWKYIDNALDTVLLPIFSDKTILGDRELTELLSKIVTTTGVHLLGLNRSQRLNIWSVGLPFVDALRINTAKAMVDCLQRFVDLEEYAEQPIATLFEQELLAAIPKMTEAACENVLALLGLMPHENADLIVEVLSRMSQDPPSLSQLRFGEIVERKAWKKVAKAIYDHFFITEGRYITCLKNCQTLLDLADRTQFAPSANLPIPQITEAEYWPAFHAIARDIFPEGPSAVITPLSRSFHNKVQIENVFKAGDWSFVLDRIKAAVPEQSQLQLDLIAIMAEKRSSPILKALENFRKIISPNTVMKLQILMLSANPPGMAMLSIGVEANEIRAKLDGSIGRGRYALLREDAVNATSMQNVLQQNRATIVHFSGHGTAGPSGSSAQSGIFIVDEFGRAALMPQEALTATLKSAKRRNSEFKLVVLNACYSADQARSISTIGLYVIGMSKAINDAAAIHFAANLYQALGNDLSIEDAFRAGCETLALLNNQTSIYSSDLNHMEGQSLVPILWHEGEQVIFYD